jgi:tRNA/rRNA methyltransferase
MTPTFVLTRPQMGENIGAAARAMLNFGIDRMRIVDPRDGWPNPAATALASGAGRVLDAASIYNDVSGAIADCTFVYATTARKRDLTKPVLTPEAAMQDTAERITAGGHVAVLFGPERSGLGNDDLSQANALISVPVNSEYPSLNLAQCVLLIAYEWMKSVGEVTETYTKLSSTDWATGQEVEYMARHFEERLANAGFFYPENKSESMRLNLRNMWSRMSLTKADVQMLHGMLRQMVRWAEHR